MTEVKIDILKRALLRQKMARKQAEKILEDKSLALFKTSEQLKRVNHKLESLLNEKQSQLKGVFENINDAYLVVGIDGVILKMNDVAEVFFGYKLNEEDPDLLDPIPFELEAIEMARKYIKQYSYREVANWLTAKTDRVISHVGLRKRLMHEKQRKDQARTLRKWAAYAEKAIEKAKAIEEERTGARA